VLAPFCVLLPDPPLRSSVLSSCGDTRQTTSFPTRRSSDLHSVGASPSVRLGRADNSGAAGGHSHPGRVLLPDGVAGSIVGAPPRSEEHTSELQSRENLVCRLLLEKKKTHELQSPCNDVCRL